MIFFMQVHQYNQIKYYMNMPGERFKIVGGLLVIIAIASALVAVLALIWNAF